MTALLASRWLYRGVLIFFVLEALWIVFSAQYPMAFDEEFHLGIIKLYAAQWLPVLPANAGDVGQFGPVVADPSFLYHYLMSFPYRIIHLFTDNQAAIVILLRLINVALFTYGIVLFSRLLLQMGVSRAFRSLALGLFVLIPVVPLLAGQINYDNVLMVVVAWASLLALQVYQGLADRKLNLLALALLLAVCIFGSVVKYAFIPIAVGVVGCTVYMLWRKLGVAKSIGAARKSYGTWSKNAKIGIATLLVVGLGLCLQRYGVNVAKYHAPLPDCAAVLSVGQCMNYGPWARNHTFAGNKGVVDPNPIKYTKAWVKGLHKRLFFMINGAQHPVYQNYPPAPILADTATALALIGLVVVCVYSRRIFAGRPIVVCLVVMTLLYLAALWYTNYSDFIQTGRPVAINGRYLIPILLPMAGIVGLGLQPALRRLPSLKVAMAVVAIVLFLQAGGVFSFILRSDDGWYWENRTVVNMNHAAKRVFDPLMYQGGNGDN